MRASTTPRTIALLPLVAVLMLLLPAGAQANDTVVHEFAQPGYASAGDMLTERRVEAAKPIPTPTLSPGDVPAAQRPVGKPTASPASGKPKGKPIFMDGQAPTIGPLASADKKVPRNPKVRSGAVPPGFYGLPPFRANGRLFMSFNGQLYTCSATVVPSRSHTVILTAGHCIFDKSRGFADSVAFVPAYFGGRFPFGYWVGTKVVTNREWVKRKNEKFDYAAIKVAAPQGAVGNVVGESGLAINAPRRNKVMALGYPSNLGGGEVMWTCLSKLIGTDPFDRGKGKKNIAIGCNMSYGCSGGSWEFSKKKKWYVNSVSSYFYKTKRFRNILFGPYLTKRARKVVHKAHKG